MGWFFACLSGALAFLAVLCLRGCAAFSSLVRGSYSLVRVSRLLTGRRRRHCRLPLGNWNRHWPASAPRSALSPLPVVHEPPLPFIPGFSPSLAHLPVPLPPAPKPQPCHRLCPDSFLAAPAPKAQFSAGPLFTVLQCWPPLCDPMDCNSPGSSVHRVLQAGILERVAMPFCRGSSQPRDLTRVSYIAGRFLTV